MELTPMASSRPGPNIFSVRIVSIDYYMARPLPGVDICYSSFQGENVNEVPVIRVYGSTPAGQKTCLHVHQALPYLYVPCADIPLSLTLEGDSYINTVSLEVEKALKLRSNSAAKRQHVHGCSLVRARRFYSYHASEELFAKIYLYNPHDIVRAAKLLLAGVVFDRSLQPHESHFPYLLQFMVDYNLYGMGHLHVTKMKFRNPVPASFSSKLFNYDGQMSQESNNSTSQQADLIGDAHAHLKTPVWVTSTVPGNWRWQIPSEDDTLSYQTIDRVKRRSVCELEGDAIVDDIVNQHFKTYLSLSQAPSDVKMVQSLVPIWEEFEMMGMHEAVIPPDPGKPSAEYVLKSLSPGLDLGHKLIELCDNAENILNLTPSEKNARSVDSIQLPSDEEKLIDYANANLSYKYGELVQHSDEKDGSLSTLFQGKGFHRESFSAEDKLSQLTDITKRKVADKEALSLLKWLATSQAVEDINSDDELAREVILSPLLPATTADKVLEKATMDYEAESQRECQDILDSVDNAINFEGLDETVDSNYSDPSPKKRIPQVDGSCDDLYSLPNTDSAELSSELEKKNEHKKLQAFHHAGNCSSKKKMKSSSWGSLPFYTTPKEVDNSETKNFDMSDGSPSGDKDQNLVSSNLYTQTKEGNSPEISTEKLVSPPVHLESANIGGCSVRDLMRKKRHHRFELHSSFSEQKEDVSLCHRSKLLTNILDKNDGDMELVPHPHSPKDWSEVCGGSGSSFKASTIITEQFGSFAHLSHKLETVADVGSQELKPAERYYMCTLKDQSQSSSSKIQDPEFSTGLLGAHGEEGSNFSTKLETVVSSGKPAELLSQIEFPYGEKFLMENLQPIDACNSGFAANSLASKSLHKDVLCDDGHSDKQILRACSSSMPIENIDSYDNAKTTKELDSIHGEQDVGDDADLSATGTKMSAALGMVDKSSCLISMSFCEKPPILDGNHEASEDVAHAKAITYNNSLVEGNSYMGFSGKVLDETPPSFMVNFQEDQGLHKNESCCHQEVVIGVPTHYLNDGSCLYLLTPAISPPSVDTIKNWLSSGVGSFDPPVVRSSRSSREDGDVAVPGANSPPPAVSPRKTVYCKKEENGSVQTDIVDNGTRVVSQSEESPTERKLQDCCSQDISQISGPDRKSGSTPLSQLGFRDPASVGAGQQLTILSVEVQAESRGDLRPDPRFDAISVLTLAVMADNDPLIEVYVLLCSRTEFHPRSRDGLSDCKMLVFLEEKNLLLHFTKIISKLDPDILVGWDVQGGSIGFLAERASYLGIGLLNLMSRTPSADKIIQDSDHIGEGVLQNVHSDSLMTESGLVEEAIIEDEWGRTHASGVHVGGRIVLNLWRVMRCEVKLSMYTLEAVTEAVLRQKTPSIQHNILTKWFSSGSGRARYRCIEYLIKRTKLNLQIMNQLDLVNRTSELARVFGIDFFSVLSRGSQYRVESMFLRLAHTQNYVAISPGSHQVASQPAMECLPLVMEPESGFYGDPVVVLDFQSLYPSMIIAYNLCFCTCLGKVPPSRENTLGVTSYSPDPRVLRDLKDQIFLAPNGAMYVPPKVCKGILPRLLEEILSTRIMVKQAMKKLAPSQQVLYRILNARQLALKLIANVTYGYTAAGFSGRMPCAELADSIVQCGRRTLENAISYINAHAKWNARVIYGDTDSMFVLLKGRSVKEAFQIGQEIVHAISGMNPDPVTLKMEKVYHPCFLLTKKRYVGYSYESPDQVDPIFDAKGIETVRRDTCDAVAKAMEQTLRLYFEHQDISKVKAYLYRQWTRILSGRVSLQDFVFAKEVRLGTYSTRPSSSLPPAAIVATKAMRIDPRAEPRYGERIPYVVVHGEPGARLVDMVVDPLDLLALDSPFRLNGLYYITKQIIPALQRVFGLVGADLSQWFLEMPRPTRENLGKRPLHTWNSHRTRIDYYYLSRHCVLCGELVPTSVHLCSKCSQRSDVVAAALTGKASKMEKEMHHLAAICRHCGGGDWVLESGVKCTSLACPVFYERRKVQKELQSLSAAATEADFYPKCAVEWF